MLTEVEVRDLVAAGEQFEVEFKGEEREPLNDRDLVEAVVCLANGRGGVVLVGVEDDGRVTGARPRHGSLTDVRRVEAMIANHTAPGCPVECSIVRVSDAAILVCEVPPGLPVTATTGGVYKRRATDLRGRPQCLPFLPHEVRSREADRGAADPSAAVIAGASWEDLDPLEFERLRQTVDRNRGRSDLSLLALSDEDLVKALGFGEGTRAVDRIRLAGLLMLGRESSIRHFVPTHEAAFQVLTGTRVAVNDFFRWPLIRLADELAARFDRRNEEEEIALGPVRVGIPDYSRPGYREAVHNALVHRDYTRLGTVHVQWRDEAIDVTSPGGFVNGVRLDNLLVTPPKPRNPILADAFKRVGLVERTGRGIDTIFEGQLRYGRPAPDYTLSTDETVYVTLAGGPANLALARFLIERDSLGRPISVDEMLIVNEVERGRRIDAAQAAVLTQRPPAVAAAVLERLVEAGVLEAKQEHRERVYHLSAASYRALGMPAAHVRIRGFEPIRQEQMVLQFVDAHGSITRSGVAELCGLGSVEARSLLRRLMRRRALVQSGTGRRARYERPAGVPSA